MLKLKVKSLDDVPEALHDFYEKDGDVYRLKVQGAVPKEKLDEFRNTNVSLMKKLEKLESQLSGVDLDEYRALKEKMAEFERKKLIDAGQIDKLLEKERMQIRQQYEQKLEQFQKQASTYKQKLSQTVLQAEIPQAVLQVAKPKKGALKDILLKAQATWRVDDEGNLLPVGPDGEVIKDDDGPITPRKWAERLVQESPYFFEGSGGGGASGGAGSGTNGSKPKISIKDKQAFIKNLDKIAKGEVEVIME